MPRITLATHKGAMRDELTEIEVSASNYKQCLHAEYVKFGGMVYKNAKDTVHEGYFMSIHPVEVFQR